MTHAESCGSAVVRPHINHQIARHGHGNLVPQLLTDHMKRQIDARSHTRTGHDLAVLYEDAIPMHRRGLGSSTGWLC